MIKKTYTILSNGKELATVKGYAQCCQTAKNLIKDNGLKEIHIIITYEVCNDD